jgi:hypothetical protein
VIAKVYAAQLTGVDKNQQINFAIAIAKGKTDAPSTRLKDVNPGEWIYYRAWVVLKDHVSFMPPQAVKEKDSIDIDKEAEEEETIMTVTITVMVPLLLPSPILQRMKQSTA